MADLILRRGDDESLTITVLDANDEPVNLSGATAWMTIKRRASDADADAVVQKTTASGITISDPLAGRLAIAITAADLASVVPGVYLYDVQVKVSGRTSTVVAGTVQIGADITLSV